MKLTRPSRRVIVVATAVAAVLVLIAILDYWFFPLFPGGGSSANRGQNGLWMRYTWYFGEQTPADMRDLAQRLNDHGIRSAYFHVRFIGKNGTLKFHFPDQAKELNRQIARLAPQTTRYAYVYVGNARGRTGVVLSDPKIRAKIVAEARWLIDTCGFDGIQWDYEVCLDQDAAFLALLDETRRALPGVPISAATPVWMPPPIHHFGWSESYYSEVAKRCDEIAVMCYDTGFATPRAYDWLTEQNVARVCRAAAAGNPRCRVLIGLPTYKDGLGSHNLHAENLSIGLYAVRHAPHPPNLAGIALFADYTTDANEWKTFDTRWPLLPRR